MAAAGSRSPLASVDMTRTPSLVFDCQYSPSKSEREVVQDLAHLNENVFGHNVFRQNQLDIIKVWGAKGRRACAPPSRQYGVRVAPCAQEKSSSSSMPC
jgi:hypothetical protein